MRERGRVRGRERRIGTGRESEGREGGIVMKGGRVGRVGRKVREGEGGRVREGERVREGRIHNFTYFP